MRLMNTAIAAGAVALLGAATVAPAQADHWRYHYHYGHPIAAGVAGLAVGAIVGSALARPAPPPPVYVAPAPVYVAPAPVYAAPLQPWTPAWYAYCADKFRSFDARSGTYLGYDGQRHMCR